MDDFDAQFSGLKARLDEHYDWPSRYPFKFITPIEKLEELEVIFGGLAYQTRHSKNGNYVSLTARLEMESTEHVLSFYRRVAQIDGAIAL